MVLSLAAEKSTSEWMETMETKKEFPNAYAGVAFGVIGTVVAFTLVAQFNRKKVQATNEFALI